MASSALPSIASVDASCSDFWRTKTFWAERSGLAGNERNCSGLPHAMQKPVRSFVPSSLPPLVSGRRRQLQLMFRNANQWDLDVTLFLHGTTYHHANSMIREGFDHPKHAAAMRSPTEATKARASLELYARASSADQRLADHADHMEDKRVTRHNHTAWDAKCMHIYDRVHYFGWLAETLQTRCCRGRLRQLGKSNTDLPPRTCSANSLRALSEYPKTP